MKVPAWTVALILAGVLGSPCLSEAALTPAKCAAKKHRIVGKRVAATLLCWAKARRTSSPVDAICLQKAIDKFASAMTRAGTACSGDAASLAGSIDLTVNNVLIDVPDDGDCPYAKIKAAGKASKAISVCTAKALAKVETLAACLAKADAKLTQALARAGTCTENNLAGNLGVLRVSLFQLLPPGLCGNAVREPGEACEGGAYCQSTCFLPNPSPACCQGSGTCFNANGFSLFGYLFMACNTPINDPVPGGICSGAGTCDVQSIDTVPLCCQLQGSCYEGAANATDALWHFRHNCTGGMLGTVVPGGACDASGYCVPG